MSLNVGVRLGDRYELVGRIAAGGMGEVWRGMDTTLQRIVAVKVLRSEFAGDPTFVARFRTEARNTAMLSHVNIAQVYDYGEALAQGEKVAYLVMELVDGDPLSNVLANATRLEVPRALDVLRQTAAGLGVAHRAGVVHRDVKPANLIIRPDRVVKITDFGISRATDHVPLTGTGMVVGTAQYLSPEQAMGRTVTSASDVYALGVVGYEALAGRRPFDGESSVAVALAQVNQQPAPLPSDVPGPIRDLIQRAMSKNPQQRYHDGDAFVSAIRAVEQGRTERTRLALAPVAVPNPGTTRRHPPVAEAPRGGKPPTARMPAARPPRPRPAVRPVNYGPPPPPPAKPRTGQWATILVLVALLIAGGLLAVWIIQNPASTQNASPSDGVVTSAANGGTSDAGGQASVPPPPDPAVVTVDTASYVGQPIDDVQAALEDLGLVVDRRAVDVTPEVLQAAGLEDQAFEKNAVISTLPTQAEVEVGTTVVVFFAKKNYEPDNGNGIDGNG